MSQQKLIPQQTTKDAPPAKSEPPSKTEPPKKEEESSFFGFGFGGARSRPPSPQPGASSVSGKVLGFGSSFLSSASNLISAVQDEPSTTPPTSRKGSAVSQTSAPPTNPQASSVSQTSSKTTTPPTSGKGSTTSQGAAISVSIGKANESVGQKEEKKTEPTADQKNKAPISKESEPSSQMPKAVKGPQPPPKSCPLCKVEIKKDLVNYSTCTECKNTVCNLCGFNPTPHQTENEWLCLNCQTQRALKGMEPPGPPKLETAEQPNKNPVSQPLASPSIQKKGASGLDKFDKKTDPAQKLLQDQQSKAPNGTLPIQKAQQQENKAKSEVPAKTAKEESGFFGFGGVRSRSPSPQPAVSAVSGKVLGFGSSFLSSASNLISSAVQDETSTTPPTSRKASTVSQTSTPPTSRKSPAVPQTTNTDSRTDDKSKTELGKQKQNLETPKEKKNAQKETLKPQQSKDGTALAKSETTTKKDSSKEDTGFFGFGFSGARSRSPSPQPVVTEKVMGFGSSFLSSASNLISSVVQDESSTTPPTPRKGSTISQTSVKSTTPPVSRKGSSVSQTSLKTTTPPTSRKGSSVSETIAPPSPRKGSAMSQSLSNSSTSSSLQKGSETMQGSPKALHSKDTEHSIGQKQEEQTEFLQQAKESSNKVNEDKSETPKDLSKPLPKVCPLCKVELKKDQCNSCTECKNIVCNLCGFNPIPHQNEVSKYYCSASNLISTAVQDESFKSPSSSRKASTASQISDKTPPTSRKGSAVSQIFDKMNASPPSSRKGSAVSQTSFKMTPPTSRKGSEAAVNSKNNLDNTDGTKNKVAEKGEETTKVSRGRSQSPLLPPAASAVSGKVLGFGSSFFSSASNLISSALDLSAKTTTPPSSRKGSSVSQTSDKITTSPSSRKGSEVSLTSLKTSKLPTSQKVSDASPKMHHSDDKKVNPENIEEQKTVPKACPLCTVDLQKEPPNYDTCTACKNTVCTLCGFNPMPHDTEVSSLFYIEEHKKHLIHIIIIIILLVL
ncbi:hypothetical protein PO909_032247 [Leuciscus waleckii]